MHNYNKINNLINECKYMNIKVVDLNINSSKYNFYINKDNNIEYVIGIIKGLKKSSIDEIIKDRNINGNYKSILDFCIRINKKILNKKNIEILIKYGLFNSLKINKNRELKNLDIYIKRSIKINKDKLNKQMDIFEDKI